MKGSILASALLGLSCWITATQALASDSEPVIAATRPGQSTDPCLKAQGGKRNTWIPMPQSGIRPPGRPDGPATLDWTGRTLVFFVNGIEARFNPCSRKWGPVSGTSFDDPRSDKSRWPRPGGWNGHALGTMDLLPAYNPRESSYDGFAGATLKYPSGKSVRLSRKGAPAPRTFYALAAGSGRLVVWGGWGKTSATLYGTLGDGAVCDTGNGRWKAITRAGAPSPRFLPVVAWTGRKLVVWGGARAAKPGIDPVFLADGALYDPARDAWTPMSTEGAPPPRFKPVMVWTGKVLLIAGGGRDLSPGGARGTDDAWTYDPAANRWSPVANPPQLPEAKWWVKTFVDPHGHVLILDTMSFNVHLFDPESRSFLPTGIPDAVRGRTRALFAWTGGRLFVWGGFRFPEDYKNPCEGATRPCDPPSPHWAPLSDGWEYVPR